MVEGIPRNTTLGNITYTMQVEHRNEQFQWAHEWVNIPGEGTKFEPNAVPTSIGYQSSKSCSLRIGIWKLVIHFGEGGCLCKRMRRMRGDLLGI